MALDGMTYEKRRLKPVKKAHGLVRERWASKQVHDIRKLSTFRIMLFVYKRHELAILQTALVLVATWLVVIQF